MAAMPPVVYIESSVVSYLVARPSRDLVVAAHQAITAEWWANNIANERVRKTLAQINASRALATPMISTPEELLDTHP
jgi:hypothetical protein